MYNSIQTKLVEEDVKTAGHSLHACHVHFGIRICVSLSRNRDFVCIDWHLLLFWNMQLTKDTLPAKTIIPIHCTYEASNEFTIALGTVEERKTVVPNSPQSIVMDKRLSNKTTWRLKILRNESRSIAEMRCSTRCCLVVVVKPWVL